MSQIKRVGVLGCGLMGSGIAQASASAGFTPVARDTASGRLSFTTEMADLRECDIVIEAVTEDLALKNELWRELDRLCPPTTIFASNTSSLTIAAMAAATQRPDRFVGLHFFNPVPLMPLVEVVR